MSIMFFVVAILALLIGLACHWLTKSVHKGVNKLTGGKFISRKINEAVDGTEAMHWVWIAKYVSYGISAVCGALCVIFAIAELIIYGSLIAWLGTYTREETEGQCQCIAECIYGADSVDLIDSGYEPSALWANGFYLTHDSYSAAAFMNYAMYVEGMGAFRSPATGGAWYTPVTNPIAWGPGTDYECNFSDFMGVNTPLIYIPYAVGTYGEDYSYTVTINNSTYNVYMNTDFYRYKHMEYLAHNNPQGSYVITVAGEHSYLQSLLDHNTAAGEVSIEDWEKYPEISSTVGHYFVATYDYVSQHKGLDGTQADYETMVGELASLARFYNGEKADSSALSELSEAKYYAFGGVQKNTADANGVTYTPMFEDDAVYQDYYKYWTALYGESDESLADMIYFIMSDNKFLGVNRKCSACSSSYSSCEGAKWYVSYVGLFQFIKNERVDLDYADHSVSDNSATAVTVSDNYVLNTGGNNIGEATGDEYVWSYAPCTGNKSFYVMPMTAQDVKNINKENLKPHTVIDGVDYTDGNIKFRCSEGADSWQRLTKAACPTFSIATCLSNLFGTPITPLMVLQATGLVYTKEEVTAKFGMTPDTDIAVVLPPHGGWLSRPSTNSSEAEDMNSDSSFMEFCYSYDPSFTVCRPKSAQQCREAFMDTTKNTVLRMSRGVTRVPGSGYIWSTGEVVTEITETGGTQLKEGHFFYVLDYDANSDQVMVGYNSSKYAFWWYPLDTVYSTFANIQLMQTDKRTSGYDNGPSTTMSNIEGFANPTDIETGRIDISLLENSGVDVGSRRFDGSWYTKINGWTQSTEPALMVPVTTTEHASSSGVKTATFALYDTPPFNYNDFTSVYFYDVRYAGTDMCSWYKSTLNQWGINNVNNTVKDSLNPALDYQQNVFAFTSDATKYTYAAIPETVGAQKIGKIGKKEIPYNVANPDFSPFVICAQPALGISATNGAEPGTDTYWEKYHDVSGLYSAGGFFTIDNYVNDATYKTPYMAVVKDSTGKLYYIPGIYNDAKGHYFPFASGQSGRKPKSSFITDINDPNAVMVWALPITDSGPNLLLPQCASVEKNTGVVSIDYASLGSLPKCLSSYKSNKTSGEAKAAIDAYGKQYGLKCTFDESAQVAGSTTYDYFNWVGSWNGDSEGSGYINPTVVAVEADSTTKALLKNGYELVGYMLCSQAAPGGGSSDGYAYNPKNPDGSKTIGDIPVNSMGPGVNSFANFSVKNTFSSLSQELDHNFTAEEKAGNSSAPGRVDITEIQTREIAIYTPYGYDGSTQELPTLYVVMGDSVHPYTSTGKAGFMVHAEKYLNYHIAAGDVPPMIVVSIAGAPKVDGKREISIQHDKDGNGVPFILDVVNYVDSNYRTVKDPKARVLGGMSNGANAVSYLKEEYRASFGFLIESAVYSTRNVEGAVNGTSDYILAVVSCGGDGTTSDYTRKVQGMIVDPAGKCYTAVSPGGAHDVPYSSCHILRLTSWYFNR